jgi:periplasmic protein TonB
MQFYWAPEAQRAEDAPPTVRTRLARFLTLSTAAHVAAAGLATWLSLGLLPSRVDESQLVRTIDFVEPAPARAAAPEGDRRESGGGTSAPVVRAPRAAAPVRPSAPTRAIAPAAPAPAPAPATASDTGDSPTPSPSPEEARLAAATPKTVASATARGPAAVSTPSPDSSASPSAAPAVSAAAGGADGPRATVALPTGLARGSGAGGGGTGSGVGAGAVDGGGASAAGGSDGTGIDLADPDFSEYFRLIEQRVRAAWKFPESLGGTTQTVKIGFALAPEGSLRDARVMSSSSTTLNESALSAMRRAAPFPPLPAKFRGLAGQPLVMSFTVTIR